METENGDRKDKRDGSVMDDFFIKIVHPSVMKGTEKSVFLLFKASVISG